MKESDTSESKQTVTLPLEELELLVEDELHLREALRDEVLGRELFSASAEQLLEVPHEVHQLLVLLVDELLLHCTDVIGLFGYIFRRL